MRRHLLPLTPIFNPLKSTGQISPGDTPTGVPLPPSPVLMETVIVPGTSQVGVLATGGPYGEVTIVVTGIYTFYAPSAYADAETVSPALGGGHGGGIEWSIGGGAWQHIEPIGGPYSTPQPGNLYTYLVDLAGQSVRWRCADSNWGDNTGGFTVKIYI